MIFLRTDDKKGPPRQIGMRGMGASPLVSDAEVARQQAALDRLTNVGNGFKAKTEELLGQIGPSLSSAAQAVYAASTGDYVAAQNEWVNATASAASLLGPVGAAVGALLRAFQGLANWLVKTYPAHQVVCAKSVHNNLPAQLGASNAGKAYRDDQWLYVASYDARSGTGYSFSRMEDGSNSTGYYGQSTMELKLAELAFAAQPKYFFEGDPPRGYLSWREYVGVMFERGTGEKFTEADQAASMMGQQYVERLQNEGELTYRGWQMSNTCWAYVFCFKVQGLTNTTLTNLIARLGFAAEGEDVDVVRYLEPIALPGVGSNGILAWRDGLSEAIMGTLTFGLGVSPNLTYHTHALITEYKRRVDEGIIVVPARRTLVAVARPQVQERVVSYRPTSTTRSVRVTVGSTTGAANVTKEAPLTLRTAALMPVGSGLSSVIDGKRHRCDCHEVRPGEIECRCSEGQ